MGNGVSVSAPYGVRGIIFDGLPVDNVPVNTVRWTVVPYAQFMLGGSADGENATFALYAENRSNFHGTRAIMVEKSGAAGYGIAVNNVGSPPPGAWTVGGYTGSLGGADRLVAYRADFGTAGADQRGYWGRQRLDSQQNVAMERVGVMVWWFTVLGNGRLQLRKGNTWPGTLVHEWI